MAAKSGNRVLLYVALAILAAVVFFGWRFYRSGAIIDESAVSGMLESTLSESLSKAGVLDNQIKRVQRVERREWFPIPVLWIETQREVHLEKSRIPALVSSVKAVSDNLSFTFLESAAPGNSGPKTAEFARFGRVYHRLIFIPEERSARKIRARAAIVIDDVAGRPSDIDALNAFLALGIPLTYAVLPEEKNAEKIIARIRRFGGEIILHQPMEPDDASQNEPGPSSLLVSMSELELRDRLIKCLRVVPYAQGISNHMGSKFTADADAMRRLARAIKKAGTGLGRAPLFFFDSHTTPVSAAQLETSRAGVDYLENGFFIDNQDDADYVVKQLRLLKKTALKKSSAAAIGHIHRKFTAEAIAKVLPEFRAEGVKLVLLSDLLKPAVGKRP